LPAAEATALRAVDFRAPMTRCENDGAPPLSVGQAVEARKSSLCRRQAVARSTWLRATGASDREAEGRLVAKPGAATTVQ